MQYLDSSGRVRQQQSFTCGQCKHHFAPALSFRDGTDPAPQDLKIDCPVCNAYVATINPSEAAASIAPPAAAPDAIQQRAADAQTPELERAEEKAAADMQTEAEVAKAAVENLPPQQ